MELFMLMWWEFRLVWLLLEQRVPPADLLPLGQQFQVIELLDPAVCWHW
jgi:hypothetical protein